MNCKQVKKAQEKGIYKETGIDLIKSTAAFRLVDICNGNRIIWSDGRGEIITDRRLAQLQLAHAWHTDF